MEYFVKISIADQMCPLKQYKVAQAKDPWVLKQTPSVNTPKGKGGKQITDLPMTNDKKNVSFQKQRRKQDIPMPPAAESLWRLARSSKMLEDKGL